MAFSGMRVLVAGLPAIILALPSIGAELRGNVRVIDGDTIEVAGWRVRLHGIGASELDQTCWDVQGEFPCGLHVKVILETELAGQVVTCEEITTDRYGWIVAICRDGDGVDLGRALVRGGWAMAYRRYSLDYVTNEEQPRASKRGLWMSRFTPPWDWRKKKRESETVNWLPLRRGFSYSAVTQGSASGGISDNSRRTNLLSPQRATLSMRG